MLKQAWIVFAMSGLVLALGARHSQAGWSEARSNLAASASSPIISIKKHKNDDGDDDGDNDDHHNGKQHDEHHHGKHKKNDGDAGQSQGQSVPNGGDKDNSASGGSGKDVPAATLLLPYFECDLSNKEDPCNKGGQK